MKAQIEIDLKIENIHDKEYIKKIASSKSKILLEDIKQIEFLKRSLDCRSQTPKYKLLLNVFSKEEEIESNRVLDSYRTADPTKRVIIVGAGPAGYFAALELLEYGITPIVLERGKDVQSRRKDLKNIMQNGVVNPDSNYCFGEGGAGTYSDGKLYTRSNKRGNVRKVLNIFVEHGADPDILVDAQAHIGSDKLPKIINEIRNTIISFGGEVHFDSKVTDLIVDNSEVKGVIVNDVVEYRADYTILATGHSARDIYYLFDKNKFLLESKPFAIGFRVEHYQELINKIQHGNKYAKVLPAASYKLVAQVGNRGIFSFCMCPGGIIVPATTNPNELLVNGMSMSARNSKFANSGIVCSVNDADFAAFADFGVLAGLKFQESLEQNFYLDSYDNYLKAPAQRMVDFIKQRESSTLMETSYIPGIESSNMSRLFPKNISDTLRIGLDQFGKKMKGFMTEDANVVGLESRTSSPIRIPRDKVSGEHSQLKRLYPCGEGSGYAGGIVSSAVDGQNSAKFISELYDLSK